VVIEERARRLLHRFSGLARSFFTNHPPVVHY
jgi:hypothetical protein